MQYTVVEIYLSVWGVGYYIYIYCTYNTYLVVSKIFQHLREKSIPDTIRDPPYPHLWPHRGIYHLSIYFYSQCVHLPASFYRIIYSSTTGCRTHSAPRDASWDDAASHKNRHRLLAVPPTTTNYLVAFLARRAKTCIMTTGQDERVVSRFSLRWGPSPPSTRPPNAHITIIWIVHLICCISGHPMLCKKRRIMQIPPGKPWHCA